MEESDIISCKIAARLMSISFERKLTLSEQASLKAHLAICKTCRYCFRQLKGLRQLFCGYVRAVATLPVPAQVSLSSQAKLRLKSALIELCTTNKIQENKAKY